ncbi:hypothetical protein, partial [Geobacillus stearothermophilus]|uniref:hypothetical protein n=1 Tax=Geobacillus stearothermophilus TaxID=1422 RepID=UPI003D21C1B1
MLDFNIAAEENVYPNRSPPLRAKQQSSRFDPLTNAKSARQQTTADAFLMESDVHHFVFSQSILKTP